MKKIALLLLITISLSFGCAGRPAQQTTELAVTTSELIQSIADSANSACKAGFLSQAECDKAKKAYGRVGVAYDAVNLSLQVAIESEDESDWEVYRQIHERFTRLHAEMLKVAREFGLLDGGQ